MFAYKIAVTTITVLLMIVFAWAASSSVRDSRSGKVLIGVIMASYAALLIGMWL